MSSGGTASMSIVVPRECEMMGGPSFLTSAGTRLTVMRLFGRQPPTVRTEMRAGNHRLDGS
jgi:hypothetical protein